MPSDPGHDGGFPNTLARSTTPRQSAPPSYADCPITPKTVTDILSLSVASDVIYLRHRPFTQSVYSNEVLPNPWTRVSATK